MLGEFRFYLAQSPHMLQTVITYLIKKNYVLQVYICVSVRMFCATLTQRLKIILTSRKQSPFVIVNISIFIDIRH